MESMEKREYKKCPECDKSVKYLASHMKNKHKCRTVTNQKEFELLEKLPDYPLTADPVKMDQDGEENMSQKMILISGWKASLYRGLINWHG